MPLIATDKCKIRTPLHSALRGVALFCLALPGWHQPVAATPQSPVYFFGRAFDLDSGELVYTEAHDYQPTGLYKVIYREPDGRTFATKTSDFSVASFAPSIEQLNERNGEFIRIAHKDNNTLAATYRRARDKTVAATEIEIAANTVIDAGFHSYILTHWNSLIAGRAARIEYVVPSWLRPVALTIRASRCVDPQAQCFCIKPANALLEMFATPLDLTYNAQSRQLIEFRGTSNIAQRNGDYHRVRIVYEYPPSIPAMATTDDARAD